MTNQAGDKGSLRRRLAVTIPFIAALSSCALGRPIGRSFSVGAVEGLSARDSGLIDLVRRLADSAGRFVHRAVSRDVLDPAAASVDSMARLVRTTADSVAVRLAQRVEGDVNHSIQRLLQENFALLDRRGAELARLTGHDLTDEIGRGLTSVMAEAGDSLAIRTMGGLATGLREVLEPALHEVMQSVTDSLRNRIRQVDTTVARSETLGGLRYGLLGGGAVIIIWLGVLGIWQWRRQRRALDALIDAVNVRADPVLNEAVRSCASSVGVHDWLGSRVAARRRGDEQPACRPEDQAVP